MSALSEATDATKPEAAAESGPPQSPLELAEVRFTNAFNNQRPTLAGFSQCYSLTELHVVRDSFFFNMAEELCEEEAKPVKQFIMDKFTQALVAGNMGSYQHTIMYATAAPGWTLLMESLDAKAALVGSDLKGIWKSLEDGRLEWLGAMNAAHEIKTQLQDAIEKDGNTDKANVEGMMVWMFSLALSIPSMQLEVATWAKAVGMKETSQPLLGYDAAKWDPRRPEWRPLDLGMQEAAEKAGDTLVGSWKMKFEKKK
jgi:hypothetical protein